jgi:hypothetical protein
MHRVALPLVGLGCFLGLLLVVYSPVLFENGQFAGGNTSYFDYPLNLRVEQQWSAGRWPLWEPGQNGGTPLLGNPVAAVLYPGKVLYFLLPYAWAARLYVIAHTFVAFLGLLALGRSCGASWVGACLGALSYAFGAPLLFQYCNTNLLVGAAWVPWGLCAIDRLLRQGQRRGGVELAAVLALQVLGGDPEAAYLTAACGAGYALVLVVREGALDWHQVGIAALAACIWLTATLALASTGFLTTNGLVLAAWVSIGLGIAWRWYRRPGEARLGPMLARLLGACTLALALAAAQILPAIEFVGRSWRAAGVSATNLYRYSVAPVRAAELVWPNVFGSSAAENRSWLQAVPPVGDHEVWVNSLYMGGLTLVLALSAIGFRGVPSWRAWLTTVVVVALATCFGKYGSPLWWARWGSLGAGLAPQGSLPGEPGPGQLLQAGAGSPYGILVSLLPGFGTFRYPAKVLTFLAVGLAVLAAAGWDRVTAGDTRRLRYLGLTGLAASLVGLCLALATRAPMVAYITGHVPPDTMLGPVDVATAWEETQWALAQGAIVFAVVLALAHLVARRPRSAAALALVLLAADLALANARLIWTVPQAEFEEPSEAARLIAAAERSDPSPGPFRIHRMPGSWFPARFATTHTRHRLGELVAWARETLCPLHALPLGLEYCETIGSLEVDDYVACFKPTAMPVPARTARVLGVPAGQPVAYFPRRCFDLWGVRYFLLPASPDWSSPVRGFASFLDKTELVYPSKDILYETQSRDGTGPWRVRQDWQLRRNLAAYPRAWVVHDARIRPVASDPDTRARLIRTLIYMNDPIWSEGNRPVFDPRQEALIETDDRRGLREYLPGGAVESSESVSVIKHEPRQVELRAALDRPGLVILADTFYPGWRLTVDGRPAPILRTNRVMRGAVVPAGEHTLIYAFEPASFRVGGLISLAGLLVLTVLAWSSRRHDQEPRGSEPESDVPAAVVGELAGNK